MQAKYSSEYVKYKTCYLKLKYSNDMIGGNDKNKLNKCDQYTIENIIFNKTPKKQKFMCWNQKIQDRQKELIDIKKSDSYIPKNKIKNRVYYTVSNGALPFQIIVNSQKIVVNKLDTNHAIKIYDEQSKMKDDNRTILYDGSKHKYNYLMKFTKFEGYWQGFDTSETKTHGNSILIKINDHNYVHINHEIYRFNTLDIILDFISPMGNNDVPYPMAIGDTYIYIIDEKIMVNKAELINIKPLTFTDPIVYWLDVVKYINSINPKG